MLAAVLSFAKRYWLYAIVAVVLLCAAGILWLVIAERLRWGTYHSEGEPSYSVRYLKLLEVRGDFTDPLFTQGASGESVDFAYPEARLQGSRVRAAHFTATPVAGVACDAASFVPFATTSIKLSEGGREYTYMRYTDRGALPDAPTFLQHVYTIGTEPCMVVRYHVNFVERNDFDPDAPPSLAQSRVGEPEARAISPGRVQYADITGTFDAMRRSLKIER